MRRIEKTRTMLPFNVARKGTIATESQTTVAFVHRYENIEISESTRYDPDDPSRIYPGGI